MPLDGHSYLVSQGWSGIGSGLREGSLSRPIAMAQKRNLKGLGKDRDDAFPFWDHLFSAASTAIQIKIADSDVSDEEELDKPETTPLVLNRTVTGIISNRNPISTPASTSTSGSSTPLLTGSDESLSTSQQQQYTLLAQAKRQAAKQRLYAGFFRGLVLGPDTDETASEPEYTSLESLSKKRRLEDAELGDEVKVKNKAEKKKRRVDEDGHEQKSEKAEGKRRVDIQEEDDDDVKEKKKAEKAEKKRRKEEKRARKEAAAQLSNLMNEVVAKEDKDKREKSKRHTSDDEDERMAKSKRKADRAAKRVLKQSGGDEIKKEARRTKKRHPECL